MQITSSLLRRRLASPFSWVVTMVAINTLMVIVLVPPDELNIGRVIALRVAALAITWAASRLRLF